MSKELKEKLLVHEASRWVGVTEQGGNNKGQIIEMFQATVGKAVQESWCLSFVQYCLKQVDGLYGDCKLGPNPIGVYPRIEACVPFWKAIPANQRGSPRPGMLVFWEHTKAGVRTGLGHTGIVVEVPNDLKVITIEGNTSPAAGIQREGDGVYRKERPLTDVGDMKLLGFLSIWM